MYIKIKLPRVYNHTRARISLISRYFSLTFNDIQTSFILKKDWWIGVQDPSKDDPVPYLFLVATDDRDFTMFNMIYHKPFTIVSPEDVKCWHRYPEEDQ